MPGRYARLLPLGLVAGVVLGLTAQLPRTASAEEIPLFATCNNVATTWDPGTPLRTVAAGVSPASGLTGIFRYDNAQGRFYGFSPTAPDFANDYTAILVRFEPIFICMSTTGTFTRPDA
jgi:hypothetical protein